MKQPSDVATSAFLRNTDLLASASEAELERLARAARFLRRKTGEWIYKKGSNGTSTYLIVSGRVKFVSTNRLGNEQLFTTKEAGDFFGELALAEPAPRVADAIAARASELLEFDRREMLFVLQNNPACAMAFSRMLVRNLRIAAENLEMTGRYDARKRIWLRLMSLGQRYGTRNPKTHQIEIAHGFSQQDLADSVGMTRVMVNRQLGMWRDAGLIETDRGVIRIRDSEALESHVWGDSLLSATDPD